MRRTTEDEGVSIHMHATADLSFGSDPYYRIKVGVQHVTVHRIVPPTPDEIAQRIPSVSYMVVAKGRKRERERETENGEVIGKIAFIPAAMYFPLSNRTKPINNVNEIIRIHQYFSIARF